MDTFIYSPHVKAAAQEAKTITRAGKTYEIVICEDFWFNVLDPVTGELESFEYSEVDLNVDKFD